MEASIQLKTQIQIRSCQTLQKQKCRSITEGIALWPLRYFYIITFKVKKFAWSKIKLDLLMTKKSSLRQHYLQFHSCLVYAVDVRQNRSELNCLTLHFEKTPYSPNSLFQFVTNYMYTFTFYHLAWCILNYQFCSLLTWKWWHVVIETLCKSSFAVKRIANLILFELNLSDLKGLWT